MTRTEMMNKASRTFGLEDKWVIAFCEACEVLPKNAQYEKLLSSLFECKLEHFEDEF